MKNLTHSTKTKSDKDISRDWHLIDVSGKVLGRTVAEVVKFLQGKHRVDYSGNLDMGDYVVVINAKRIKITGKKELTKVYTSYSGYPGGLKTINFTSLLEKNPDRLFRHAVSGMLPKNKLRDRRLARLFIFPNEEHSYKDKFEIRNSKFETNSKKQK